MSRSLLALTAVVSTAATMTAVHAAAGPVDSGRLAETRLTAQLGHGSVLSLDLHAATLTTGNVLRIVAERCGADGSCDAFTTYQSALAPGALTIASDSPTATLRTQIAGRDLVLRWHPDSATVPASAAGGDFESDDSGNTSADEYYGQGPSVTVSVDGGVCDTTGAVGDGVVADGSSVTGQADAQDVSELRLPDGATIGCG